MASTKAPINAITLATEMVRGMPLERIALSICNDINNYIWFAANWKWSVGVFSPISLLADTGDYTVTYPSDFLHGLFGKITDTGKNTPTDLECVSFIPSTSGGVKGIPNQIYLPGTASQSATVRVFPKPGAITDPKTLWVFYKKTLTQLTQKTLYTGTLPFDDEFYPVFEAGVLWKAYMYADDRRSGESQLGGERVGFSGQRATFEAALANMISKTEGLLLDPKKTLDGRDNG